MSAGTPRFNIAVTAELHAELHALAGAQSITASDLVRRAVDDWDERQKPSIDTTRSLSVRLSQDRRDKIARLAKRWRVSQARCVRIMLEAQLESLATAKPANDEAPPPSTRKAKSKQGPTRASAPPEQAAPAADKRKKPASRASAPPAEPVTAPAFDLATFAQAVQAIADTEQVGRFGPRKAFISAVWRRFRDTPLAAGMTEEEFKRHLIEANRRDLLALHRADQVSLMDPDMVRDSETHHLNATFHFLEAPRVVRPPPPPPRRREPDEPAIRTAPKPKRPRAT